MAALPHNEYVLFPVPGIYIVSADLTSGQTVTLEKRHGESGADLVVETDGTALELTPANPSAPVRVEAGVYLKATTDPTSGVTARASLSQR